MHICIVNQSSKKFCISLKLPREKAVQNLYLRYRSQVVSRALASVPWVEVKWPAFHSHFHFMWHASSSSPHKNNCLYILLACLRWQPRPREHTSLARICLCCMVEYSLSVVNATLFLCCSSVTDHMLSAMPHLSIETRCRIILMFLCSGEMHPTSFYSRKINWRRIQNQLEVMFHVSLSSVFLTTIHFRSLQLLVKKFTTINSVCDLPRSRHNSR